MQQGIASATVSGIKKIYRCSKRFRWQRWTNSKPLREGLRWSVLNWWTERLYETSLMNKKMTITLNLVVVIFLYYLFHKNGSMINPVDRFLWYSINRIFLHKKISLRPLTLISFLIKLLNCKDTIGYQMADLKVLTAK